MQFGTGFSGSVVSGLYGPSSAGSASAPAGTSGPTGAPSLVAAAWGTDDGSSNAGPLAGLVGLGAWVGLIVLWWSLPR
jgi:hypothetical protein